MTGSVWIVSYVLLWAAVVLLGFSVVALLRQIGVLHTRVAPMGVHFAGEGPELDAAAPAVDDVDYGGEGVTVLAFTSPSCEICAALEPGLARLAASYDEVTLHVIDHGDAPEVFQRFRVRSTPYLVAVDGDGTVRSRGVANTLDQAEEMLAEVLAGPPIELGNDEHATATSTATTPDGSAGARSAAVAGARSAARSGAGASDAEGGASRFDT
ncbi:MAG: thioredoxin domain-containing protein, partial [Actinomycetota bacterium]